MVDPTPLNVEGVPPLKTIRELLEMSQQDFASWLGIAVSTVSRWERGIGTPMFTAGQFKKLMRELNRFGYSLEDLPDDLNRPAGQV
jgi:DNA-binding transcriptional regulator YiaG